MMNTYETSDYYTAAEVANILGLNKSTIIHRCKNSFYSNAIKIKGGPGNPHGMWLIPKEQVDVPIVTHDVATLTRQITPAELERMISGAISVAVSDAIEPLQAKIDEQAHIIQQLRVDLYRIQLDHHKALLCKLNELDEKSTKPSFKKPSFWSRILGNS